MLAALTVRDIVLIEQAALEFAPGLNVLTGETGAGKSILLDSLGLAVGGARPRRRARRRGARLRHRRVRSATRPCRPRAAGANRRWTASGEIVLRRTLAADGRSPRLHQ